MATPSSPIGFSNIYDEANGTVPVSATSLEDLTQFSYFSGPNGSNVIGFNTWGQNKGDDGIFAVQGLAANPIKFSNYRNVSYYYDQSQYQVTLEVNNNTGGDDFTITMNYMDSTLTYNYLIANTPILPSSTFGPQDMTISTTPLIYGCNWNLQVEQNPFYSGNADITLYINGVVLINKVAIPATFPAPTFYDYTTYGNEYMTIGQPSGATGSVILIDIN
jgi:hypothetical protein